MLNKFQIAVFYLLLICPSFSFADDWNYHGSGRDTTYSQRIDDYYGIGYVPHAFPVDSVNVNMLTFSAPPGPLQPIPLTPAPPDTYTVTFPDGHGGITAVVIKRTADGFVGPKGELYLEFPKVWQLRMKYGGN